MIMNTILWVEKTCWTNAGGFGTCRLTTAVVVVVVVGEEGKEELELMAWTPRVVGRDRKSSCVVYGHLLPGLFGKYLPSASQAQKAAYLVSQLRTDKIYRYTNIYPR